MLNTSGYVQEVKQDKIGKLDGPMCHCRAIMICVKTLGYSAFYECATCGETKQVNN